MRRILIEISLVAIAAMAAACGDDTLGNCGPHNCAGCCTAGQCVFNYQGCGPGGALCSSWKKCSSTQTCNKGQCVEVSSCGPDSCTGCCIGDQCKSGTEASFCGSAGNACATCTPPDQQCVAGTCKGDTACGPGKCAGCCVGNQCMPGTDPGNCGKGGAACANCTPGQCSAGVCQTQACGPGKCTGCCYQNVCLKGDSSALCGSNGVQCVDCTATGKVCDATTKQCVAGACGPSGPGACSGCCDSTGKCAPGTNTTACGKAGVACVDCSQSSQICGTAQTCVAQPPPPPTCNASNCASGCCDSTGCVSMPDANKRCGLSGAACKVCVAGQECVNGQCVCTPASCPAGCCQGNVCKAGTDNPACGSGGTPCVACTGTNVCNKTTKKCEAGTPACSSANCSGPSCCAATGCVIGADNKQCGTSGNACQDCTTSGKVCVLNQCITSTTTCSSCSTTAGQCCGANGCQAGNTQTSCGTKGAPCSNCTTGVGTFPPMLCASDYTCQANPTTKWKVLLDRVVLDSTWNFEGSNPGTITDLPDVFVEVWAGGQYASSTTINDDNAPIFGSEVLLTGVTAQSLMGPPDPFYHQTGFAFHVGDDDTWPNPNDDIAQCFSSLTTEALYVGSKNLVWCFYDCTHTLDPMINQYFPKYMIKEVCFQFVPM